MPDHATEAAELLAAGLAPEATAHALLAIHEQLADMRAITAPPAKLPTRATGPSTQPIGPHTAALLWRARDLTVHDGDVPGKQVLCRDGEMVGFAAKASYIGSRGIYPWVPTIDQLPRIHAVMQCLLDFAYAETGGAEPGVPLCDVADVAYRILDTLAEMEIAHD